MVSFTVEALEVVLVGMGLFAIKKICIKTVEKINKVNTGVFHDATEVIWTRKIKLRKSRIKYKNTNLGFSR